MTLQGRRIALTRPLGLNHDWQQALLNTGAEPVLYPLLRLQAVTTELPAAAHQADGFIFISPAAVTFSRAQLQANSLPGPQQQLAAIGKGTAAALLEHGAATVLHPPDAGDSDSLLQLMPDVDGQHWVLVRGEGGRERLPEVLKQRGAILHDWRVYRREPDLESMQRLLQDLDTLDALLLTSSESVRTLFAQAGESLLQRLQSKPLLVLHPRIGEAAAALGALRCIVCQGAADLPAAVAAILENQCP